MNNEPVSIFAALTAAIQATLAILLVLGVEPDLVAAIAGALIAWIALAAVVVRSKVTPTSRVALTTEQANALDPSRRVNP